MPVIPIRQRLAARLPRFTSALLSSNLDNAIYRHEIGLNSLGRLSGKSPVLRAHLLMAGLIGASGVAYLAGGALELARFSGGCLIAVAVASHAIAFRHAFLSLWRERVTGALEQIYLTPISHEEFFEGKFYGCMTPFFEARRYVILLAGGCVASVFHLYGWFGALVAAHGALAALNHYGFAANLGVLAGLQAGSSSGSLSKSYLRSFLAPPALRHAGFILKSGAVPLLVLGMLSLFFGGLVLWLAPLILIFVPFATAYMLQQDVGRERGRVAIRFKDIFRFDLEAESADGADSSHLR